MAAIILWAMETTSNALRCPPSKYIGEIWKLERRGMPHSPTGEPIVSQDSAWNSDGTIQNVDLGRVRVDAVASGVFDLDGTKP